jgi:hypothetical protein
MKCTDEEDRNVATGKGGLAEWRSTSKWTTDRISFTARTLDTLDTLDRNSWRGLHNRDAARRSIVGNIATGWLNVPRPVSSNEMAVSGH